MRLSFKLETKLNLFANDNFLFETWITFPHDSVDLFIDNK